MQKEDMNQQGEPEKQKDGNWGRNTEGTLFRVPATHDMLDNLFSDFPPKPSTHSLFELSTLGIVSLQIAVLFIGITWGISRIYFLVVFASFRCLYNLGLGLLLKRQSQSKWLVEVCRSSRIFDREFSEKSRGGKRISQLLRRELSFRMGLDYSFDSVPLEFNVWLLFRALVDFVLLNDFTAYVAFAIANFTLPSLSTFGMIDLLRYLIGVALLAFNLWVKLDAHRVVKDFAWYWGDFFFLIDKNLTFDGVFEMVPHPMYSIGYSGYYGVSLIANSYMVFFVSLAAHAAQFAFLYLVEEPHIQKTYGGGSNNPALRADSKSAQILYGGDSMRAYFRRDLIAFWNFDWYRASDVTLAWSTLWALVIAFPFPAWLGVSVPQWFVVGHAAFWRVIHSFVIGIVLDLQSRTKSWTRHFIKFGGSNQEAFNSWKLLYTFSLTMTYASFTAAGVKCYYVPDTWEEAIQTDFLMRQVLGVILIAIHILMSVSVFEVLGGFGWFYGDFFIDEFPAELHYTGIYRYLNNPEKSLGLASIWGIALISGNKWMFLLSVMSHCGNWWFLEYVETPHMKRIYGLQKMRKESGVSKTLRNQLLERPSLVSDVNKVIQDVNKAGRDMMANVEKMVVEKMAGTLKSEVEKVLDITRPRIDEYLSETRTMISETTARLATIGKVDSATIEQMKNLDPNKFKLELPVATFTDCRTSGFVCFSLGEPISVYWTAPREHSPNDWVGIYKLVANPSKAVTTASSKGAWRYVEQSGKTEGKLVFSGDSLPWEVGAYEIRYHFDDKYLVVARTDYFEIKGSTHRYTCFLKRLVDPHPILDDFRLPEPLVQGLNESPLQVSPSIEKLYFEDGSPILYPGHPNSFDSIIQVILPLYRRAFDDPSIQAETILSSTSQDCREKASRIAYGIKLMYGIEFSWKTVLFLEPSAARLAEKIQEARISLAPTLYQEWKESHPGSPGEVPDNTKFRGLTLAKQMELVEKERRVRASEKRSLSSHR